MQTSQPVNTVLVDDSDLSIQYGLGWVNKPSLLAQSDPNYPMYGTLHETVTQTNLTYSFSGSYISACALVAGKTSQIDGGTSLWNCSVDRVQVGTTFIPPTTVCCGTGVGLSTQVQHEIHISAIGSQDHPISFDYLTYETSLAVSVADLQIYPDGPTFSNIEGWDFEGQGITTEPKANFTFDFYGSSILWFSFYNTTTVGLSDGEVTYSVDDSLDSELYLRPSDAKQALNASGSDFVPFLLFQTFALPRGQHRLEVKYKSLDSGNSRPLTLLHFVVQNSTTNPNLSVPTTIPTPPAAPSAGTNGARKPHLAIILGCCGAAALALLILGIFFARRRVKRPRDRASAEISTSSPVEPFNHDPASAPVGTHQKGQRPSEVREQAVVETAEVQVEAPPSYVTGPHDS